MNARKIELTFHDRNLDRSTIQSIGPDIYGSSCFLLNDRFFIVELDSLDSPLQILFDK